jgi:hypothetical protein
MKKLLSYLAPAAMLLLASCSTEPSDWTADKKVSLDLVPPGTRISENYDKPVDTAPSLINGGAINGSKHILSKDDIPTAGAVMSADVQQGTAMRPGERTGKKQVNSATPDTARGQAGSRK